MKKNAALQLAAAAVITGAAVFFLIGYFTKSDDADKSVLFICLHDATPHEFSYTIREIEAITKGGGGILCPIHQSEEINNATRCPSCQAPVVEGPHGITPEFCWKCEARLPNGGADLFHAGVH
ncbi:MAG: hypothetical protein ACTS22_08470 [Phycisphaerales bacterium]